MAVGDIQDDRYWNPVLSDGRMSTAGAVVSPETALTLDAYYACIRNISEDMSKLPFDVVRVNPDGTKTRLPGNPISALMNLQPNPAMRPQAFRESMTAAALGWGNGYAEIVFNGRGVATQLWPIHSSRVSYKLRGDTVTYTVANDDGSRVEIDAKHMLHIANVGGDGIGGYSLAALAANTIGLGIEQEASAGSFLKNGSRLSGMLVPQNTIKNDQMITLRESWQSVYGGSSGSGKVAVLPYNMDWKSVSVPAADAQFIEQRNLTVESIARWFRMPPHKVAELTHATFSNIEQQDMSYMRDTLLAWDSRWKDEIKIKLIGMDGANADIFGRHNFDDLLRPDAETRFKTYHTALQNGVLTRNEVRAKEDYPPLPGGDRLFVPLNMAPVDDEGLPIQSEAATGGQVEKTPMQDNKNAVNLAPIVQATAERLAINEANALSRAGTMDAMKEDGFRTRHWAAIETALTPIFHAAGFGDPDIAALSVGREHAMRKEMMTDTPDQRRDRLVAAINRELYGE